MLEGVFFQLLVVRYFHGEVLVNLINSCKMKKKTIILSIALFLVYIINSILYSIIRIKYIDGNELPQMRIFRSSFIQLAPTLLSVSYTHLDVYKRQFVCLQFDTVAKATAFFYFAAKHGISGEESKEKGE